MNAFFNQLLATWQTELNEIYSERETKNIFFLTLEDCFGITKTQLIAESISELSPSDLAQLDVVKVRLLQHEPYQHIVGFTYFAGLKIQVNQHVLIPRPETEELVDWISTDFRTHEDLHLFDWCTGSGCIALALKAAHPNWSITAIDVSTDALQVAQQNGARNELVISWLQDDLLQPVFQQKCSVIVSNPPYIPTVEQAEMDKHVLAFEPHLALFVPNEDPLLFYRLLAQWAKKNLIENGCIYLEIHHEFNVEMKSLLEEMGFADIELRHDLQGKFRMMKAVNKTV
jgi:release factor glutamine methyltransferase